MYAWLNIVRFGKRQVVSDATVGYAARMDGTAQASGRAFLGLIRYVKDQNGLDELRRIVAAAPVATRQAFADPIRVDQWYPYEAYVGFLRALDEHLGQGDGAYCRVLGAVAGQRDAGAIFRVYLAIASAERLIRSCERVWPSYYRNAGSMVALSWSADDTALRIHDFPAMDPRHCRLMEGWMIATMDSIGFRVNDDARESLCASRGDLYHEFRCTWQPIRR
jgi:hypothetical protein